MVQQSWAPPTPLPLHHSQPHSSGRRVESGSRSRCKADKRRHIGMGSDRTNLLSFHSWARDTERLISWKIGPSSSIKAESRPPAAAVLQNTSITHIVSQRGEGIVAEGRVRRKAGGSEAKGESEGGGEDGHTGPCAQESPGPVSAGVLPDLQGGTPFAPTAARAQSRETEWLPLLEVEEPLGVHGALSADWDMGPDVVSPYPNICPSALGHYCLFTVHMMCCVSACVSTASVTVCGSQEKKAMFRQGERCGRQWYLMVGREMTLEHTSNRHLVVLLNFWVQPLSLLSSNNKEKNQLEKPAGKSLLWKLHVKLFLRGGGGVYESSLADFWSILGFSPPICCM